MQSKFEKAVSWFLNPAHRAELGGILLAITGLTVQFSTPWLQGIILEVAWIVGVVLWFINYRVAQLTEAHINASLAEIDAKEEQKNKAEQETNAMLAAVRPRLEQHASQQAGTMEYYRPLILSLNEYLAAVGLPQIIVATEQVPLVFDDLPNLTVRAQEPRLMLNEETMVKLDDHSIGQLKEAVMQLVAGQKAFANLSQLQQRAIMAQLPTVVDRRVKH